MPVILTCVRCGASFRVPPARVPTARYCSIACRAEDKLRGADDFWSRVDKNGPVTRPELGPCWLWTGSKSKRGYGTLRYQRAWIYAHRLAYTLTEGEIPAGQDVLHACDVRLCCNPAHHFLGTNADNSADMVAKGRSTLDKPRHATRGARNPAAKLTRENVIDIRLRYAAHVATQQMLADEYGVVQTLISKIVRYVTWKHV